MSMLKKITDYFKGIDGIERYYGLQLKNIEIIKHGELLGKCECNIFVSAGALLNVESDFEGIIFGKENSKVHIKRKFSGAIYCDEIHIHPDAEIYGTIFAKKLFVEEGSIFKGDAILLDKNRKTFPIEFLELENLKVVEFIERCRR